MTQKTLVTGGKHLTLGELEPGTATTLNYILSDFFRYHVFVQLFDGGFAPQLYTNLGVYVPFLPFF